MTFIDDSEFEDLTDQPTERDIVFQLLEGRSDPPLSDEERLGLAVLVLEERDPVGSAAFLEEARKLNLPGWPELARKLCGPPDPKLEEIELLAFAPEKRPAVIEGGIDGSFASLELADRLIERSRQCLPRDIEGSEHFARLAEQVGRNGSTGRHRARIGLALAFQANAARARGALVQAEKTLALARVIYAETRPWDPPAAADFAQLDAALHQERSDFDRALILYQDALKFCERQDHERIVQILIGLGLVYRCTGRFSEAATVLGNALRRLDKTRNPLLEKGIRLNLCLCLCDEKRFVEARNHLAHFEKDSTPEGDPAYLTLRYRWINGRIADGLRDWPRARRLLEEAFEGFVEQDSPIDACLVSVDLVALLARMKDWDGIDAHLEQLVPLHERLAELVPAAREPLETQRQAMVERRFSGWTRRKIVPALRTAFRAT